MNALLANCGIFFIIFFAVAREFMLSLISSLKKANLTGGFL